MARFAVFSDLHIQAGGMFSKPLAEGQTTRSKQSFDFLAWLQKFSCEHGVDALLCCGDIFSRKDAVPIPLFNQALDMFEEITRDRTMYAIPGNHDRFAFSRNINTLYGIDRALEGFVRINEPGQVERWESVSGNIEILGIPAGYPPDEILNNGFPKPRLRTDVRILLIHECIIGAQFPNGKEVDKGWNPSQLRTLMNAHQIDICFCGDIHKPQSFPPGMPTTPPDVIRGKNIVLVGAPFQMHFGEDARRGITLFTIVGDAMVLEFVPYHGPQYITVTDKTWDLEVCRRGCSKGKNFYRFQLSNPTHIDQAKELKEDGLSCAIQVISKVGESTGLQEQLTGALDYRGLIGEYVKVMKAPSRVKKFGERYFDLARKELEK